MVLNEIHMHCTVKRPLSKTLKIGFQDQLSLNAGQKYCGMLQGEHSAILSTFIKLPFVIMIFILSIFKWPFYTDFTDGLNSDGIPERIFRKSWFWKKFADDKKNMKNYPAGKELINMAAKHTWETP